MRLVLIGLIIFVCCGPVYTQFSYISIPCAFEYSVYTIDCGTLTVPQSRTSDSGSIQLAVVTIRSTAETPAPDPVVYLAGGPGGSSTPYTLALIDSWLKPFLASRDVILVDQRGTGRSTPSLACIENSRLIVKYLSTIVSPAQTVEERSRAFKACQDRLTDEGIVTSAYTSTESAADLDDLRRALNLESWNLLGVSYGTRLALTVLRDYPEGVRSVILDSVYPPQVNLFTDVYANGHRARDAVFTACREDVLCNSAYPDLDERFWQMVRELNEQPQTVEVTIQQRTLDFVWTGDRLYNAVFIWMYDATLITRIPYYLDLLWQKKYDNEELLTAALQAEFAGLSVSAGLYMSIQCGEERPSSVIDERLTLLQTYPRLTTVLNSDLWLSDAGDAMCREWQPTPPSELENAPIISDVPVLLLSGEYDPITPPAWAELAAETLSQSQLIRVPNVGHGALRSDTCALDLATAYVNDPSQAVTADCMLMWPLLPTLFQLPADAINQEPRL